MIHESLYLLNKYTVLACVVFCVYVISTLYT